MGFATDIDIDFANRDLALMGLQHIPAAIIKENKILKHNTGVYFQDIPRDPQTGLAVYDHEEAGRMGYFKIDFLNSSIYEGVRDETHLNELIRQQPHWDLLDDKDIVGLLAHIRDHFDIVQSIKPQNIEDLAVVLALIRPGKRHLIGKPRQEIDRNIWTKNQKGFEFKRAHALCYAMAIIVQLNLLVEKSKCI